MFANASDVHYTSSNTSKQKGYQASMRVRIVTDSSSNVPQDYLERLNIIEVPAVINFGQDSYLYKVDMPLDAFYRRLASSDRLPTTAGPPPQQFMDGYRRAAEEGAEEVVAITVSSKASATYNNALIAAEHASLTVHVWDSLHVSMAAGWLAIAGAEMARDGLDSAAIITRLAAIQPRVCMAFTPLNLKYIIASGRVPRLQGMIGDLLNIKPIMVTTDGVIEPVERVRTQRKAQERMLDIIASETGPGRVRVAVGHCNVPEQAAAFAEQVKARLNPSEFLLFDLGMLAALGGPGLLGLIAYTVEES